jgi:hypothetical protein
MGYFFHGKSCVLIFTRNGLGDFLRDFFTNASGHPVCLVYTIIYLILYYYYINIKRNSKTIRNSVSL